jgi:hypothetical protein
MRTRFVWILKCDNVRFENRNIFISVFISNEIEIDYFKEYATLKRLPLYKVWSKRFIGGFVFLTKRKTKGKVVCANSSVGGEKTKGYDN